MEERRLDYLNWDISITTEKSETGMIGFFDPLQVKKWVQVCMFLWSQSSYRCLRVCTVQSSRCTWLDNKGLGEETCHCFLFNLPQVFTAPLDFSLHFFYIFQI